MTRSGITRLTDCLAEAGLLERQPSPRDRRSIHAVITAAGRLTISRMLPIYRESGQKHFLSHLSKEEVVVLASCLGKIRSAVRKPEGGAVRKLQRRG